MEKWSFLLSYCVQKFSAFNFLGEFFAMFAKDSNSAWKFLRFLWTLKPNAHETTQKNKKVPYKSAFELLYA